MIKAGSIESRLIVPPDTHQSLSEEPELEKPKMSLSRPNLPGGLVIQGTKGSNPYLVVPDADCRPQLSRRRTGKNKTGYYFTIPPTVKSLPKNLLDCF